MNRWPYMQSPKFSYRTFNVYFIYSPFAKVFKIAEFANVFQHSYCVYANTCALNHSHAQFILIFIPLYSIAYYYNILYFILLYHCIIRVNFIVEIYMLCILFYTYNVNDIFLTNVYIHVFFTSI